MILQFDSIVVTPQFTGIKAHLKWYHEGIVYFTYQEPCDFQEYRGRQQVIVQRLAWMPGFVNLDSGLVRAVKGNWPEAGSIAKRSVIQAMARLVDHRVSGEMILRGLRVGCDVRGFKLVENFLGGWYLWHGDKLASVDELLKHLHSR